MSTTEPGVVTLRTGVEMPDALVRAVNRALARLKNTNPIALYEAVEMARDPSHVPFGKTGDVLRELYLLEPDGSMHGATRDAIRALTEADGFDVRLVSPYASEEESAR